MITHEQIKHIVNSSRREREQPIEKLTVKSFEDALRIWNDPDVLDFYENKAMKWRPKHDIAVFIVQLGNHTFILKAIKTVT
jgi:hypothetical protein